MPLVLLGRGRRSQKSAGLVGCDPSPHDTAALPRSAASEVTLSHQSTALHKPRYVVSFLGKRKSSCPPSRASKETEKDRPLLQVSDLTDHPRNSQPLRPVSFSLEVFPSSEGNPFGPFQGRQIKPGKDMVLFGISSFSLPTASSDLYEDAEFQGTRPEISTPCSRFSINDSKNFANDYFCFQTHCHHSTHYATPVLPPPYHMLKQQEHTSTKYKKTSVKRGSENSQREI